VELGATQRREVQPGQGHGKGAALPARRGLSVGNRWLRGTCELLGVGYGAWQIAGSRPGRWPIMARWGSRLGAAHRRRDALPRGGASLPVGAE
jgi:hypothetical protein